MAEQKGENVARIYKQKQIESATPGQLVVLLYDAAVDHLNKAESALGEEGVGRIEKYHNALITCQNIITELIVALDLEKGGEIASNLFNLYDYMIYRLVDANIKKDLEPIKEVRELLGTLKSSWEVAVKEEGKVSLNKPTNMGLNLQG